MALFNKSDIKLFLIFTTLVFTLLILGVPQQSAMAESDYLIDKATSNNQQNVASNEDINEIKTVNNGNLTEIKQRGQEILGSCQEFSNLNTANHLKSYTLMASLPATGTDGSCTWVIEKDGTLTVAPTEGSSGTLSDWGARAISPWSSYSSLIKKAKFNGTIKAKSTRYMFSNCSNLTSIDLTNLDTSETVDMEAMFYGCSSLTEINLYPLNTSKVTNMNSMFTLCKALESLDLKPMDTSSVVYVAGMFSGCSSLKSIDLSKFTTSKVYTMNSMFASCSSLSEIDLSTFATSNVVNMASMFTGCSNLTSLDLSPLDTTNVTDMRNMFSYMSLENLDVSTLETSKVELMGEMFKGCSFTKIDISKFDTSSLTSTYGMFSYCTNLTELDLSTFNTPNLNETKYMFQNCSNLQWLNLSNMNTSKVFDTSSMFESCTNLITINLSSFDTAKVKNMSKMFFKCSKLVKIYVSDKWTTSNLTSTSGTGSLFSYCQSLIGGNGTTYDANHLDASYARIDTTEEPGYLTIGYEAPEGADRPKEGNKILNLTGEASFGYEKTKNINENVNAVKSKGEISEVDGNQTLIPNEWSLKRTNVPIAVERTYNEDGSYIDRISVGYEKSNDKDWEKFKALVDEGLNTNSVSTRQILNVSNVSLVPKISIEGYREVIYNSNGEIISETSNVNETYKWSDSAIWPFAIYEIPGFIKGTLSTDFAAVMKMQGSALKPSFTGAAIIKPELTVEGGIGFSGAAAVEAVGSTNININILPEETQSGDGNVSAGFKAYVGPLEYSCTIFNTSFPLWGNTSSALNASPINKTFETQYKTSELSRNYLNATSSWNGNIQNKSSQDIESNSNIESFNLKSGLMTTSVPKIINNGNKSYMIFQSDDESRDSLNRSVLMFSVQENGSWSEAQSVWEDKTEGANNGKQDGMADIEVVNGVPYVAWQKERNLITTSIAGDGSATLAEMGEKSSVAVAKFDEATGQFSNSEYINSSGESGFMPKLVKGTSMPTVIWVSNTEKDLLQKSGTNRIMCSVLTENGTWKTNQIGSTENPIMSLVGYSHNGQIDVAYVASINKDTELRLARTGAVIARGDKTNITSLTINEETNNLEFEIDGQINEYQFDNAMLNTLSAQKNKITSEAIINNNSVIWSSSNGSISKIYIAKKNNEGKFASPVEVYSINGSIYSFDVTRLNDNELQCVINLKENNISNLQYVTIKENSKIEVSNVFSSGCINYDGSYEVETIIKNNGTNTLNGIYANLINESGETVTQKYVSSSLESGSQIKLDCTFELSNPQKPTNLKLQITTQDNISSEPYGLNIDKSCLDLATTTSSNEKGSLIVNAEIGNKTSRDVENVVFHVYSGTGSEKTEIAKSENLHISSAGKTKTTIEIPQQSIKVNDTTTVLTYSAEVEGKQPSYLSNNTYVYEFMLIVISSA